MTTLEEISALTRPRHPDDWTEIDSAAVDTIRVLAADAVQKVGNGHPGTAMSLAPLAYTLFQRTMRHDPSDTHWLGRDRFVLSAGHSSLTLYIQLYLGGFGLELSDIESLRTWGSKTPGHPEFRHTPGVEITTGPLGQGLASAVGMAMASRYERGLFDPDAEPGASPFDHYIYVIASDGDIEEGVTSEASSLAAVQQLGNLIVFYDRNQISIEDDTNIALCEDTAARYRAYGWHVQEVEGGENVVGIEEAIANAQAVTDRPSFIALRTVIGYPAPNLMDTGKAHGAALGDDEVAAVKKIVGFDPDKTFQVREDVLTHTRGLVARGKQAHERWQLEFDAWARREPERKALLDRLLAQKLPDGWDADLPHWEPGSKALATRAASGAVLSALGPKLPELWGGSADLAGSNNTTIKGADSFGPPSISTKEYTAHWYGRTLHFGVREHAMGAILSGIVLHGPTRAYGGTFLQFSDYMRPAVRLAALMDIDTIYVWTHDSIGLGEDGPTHQPIEHLSALRAIPRLSVVRPADANETAYAWRTILARRNGSGPVGLILTRQGVPVLDGTDAEGVARGGYVLSDAGGLQPGEEPDVILIATGSEVQLAVAAQTLLADNDILARVVSMPCLEWFEAQPYEYRDAVLPPTVSARVAVEAGVAQCWHQLVGDTGEIVSIEHYGESADHKTLFREYGFTAEAVAAAAERALDN
ncbi:transketolase [Mycobacterium tuberculosis]|uniref:Transketolase n=17 Tax=Mycobacterium tuberculosis complex TaxID=77643 RepID=TKT_MYCBO|nr:MULTISPECIES: transketolase [Mycobacterium]P59956.1 RecName: Full=Transketolase; Short=TK [Mycobacterium tuberculosis variant bovis AF2122/97]P9WG24.1 RecName: Full=Transketolase; Short=TK [Mycobacterium tuberculosis CDC1551]AFE12715.1 transketolase [Mycobacterium tuberculosis RGTB423]AGJ67506.1 transketolase [Mycobacterium tuberculosis str. Beijing/NITR203]AGL30917.1 transketolase [Mycobacterium tuberculosis EAI5/NITR206]AHM07203.1 Transketolase [Mycobacterium tuberculosis variant bovis B